jgi:hypothetical protein
MKVFELSTDQMIKGQEFEKTHKCPVGKDIFGHKNFGAIGGGITYSFLPTGLGVIASVTCACGAKCDLTDVDNW